MKTIKDFVKGEVYNDTDTIRISKLDFITIVYITLYDARFIGKSRTFNNMIEAYNETDAYTIDHYRCLVQDKYNADNIVFIDAALELNIIIEIVKSYDIRTDYTISLDSVDIIRLRDLIKYIDKTNDNNLKLISNNINTILTINCADIM